MNANPKPIRRYTCRRHADCGFTTDSTDPALLTAHLIAVHGDPEDGPENEDAFIERAGSGDFDPAAAARRNKPERQWIRMTRCDCPTYGPPRAGCPRHDPESGVD